jgi:hypothetical protein
VTLVSDSPPASNQKFTSNKLTWMNCILFTTTLTPFEKCVALVIMQAINATSGDWALSDEAIAMLVGRPNSIRSVKRARQRLRKAGWLTWKRRPNQANLYRLCHGNVMDALDATKAARAELKVRRAKRRAEVTPESLPEVTPESPLHTRGTHSEKRHIEEVSKSKPVISNAALDILTMALDARAEDKAPRLRLMRVVRGGR